MTTPTLSASTPNNTILFTHWELYTQTLTVSLPAGIKQWDNEATDQQWQPSTPVKRTTGPDGEETLNSHIFRISSLISPGYGGPCWGGNHWETLTKNFACNPHLVP